MSGFTEWHFVNLVLPVFLPLLIMFVAMFITSANALSPWSAVKDGQLAWAALGMCTAALYELSTPMPGVNLPPDWLITMRWTLLLGLVLTALVAALGPMAPTAAVRQPGFVSGLHHFRVFLGSVMLTAAASWLYASVHFATQTVSAIKIP